MVRTLIEPGKVREALAELPEGRVSNGSAFAICYENQHINRIKSVRYENNMGVALLRRPLLTVSGSFCIVSY